MALLYRKAWEIPWTEDPVEFMETHGKYRALVAYYQEHTQLLEAAEVFLNHLRDVPAAIGVLFEAPSNVVLVERGTGVLLDYLWDRFSFASKGRQYHQLLRTLYDLRRARKSSMEDI